MRLFLALTGEAKFLQAFRLNGCKIFVYEDSESDNNFLTCLFWANFIMLLILRMTFNWNIA